VRFRAALPRKLSFRGRRPRNLWPCSCLSTEIPRRARDDSFSWVQAALLDRIVAAIPLTAGVLHRELLQIQIGEVALMPLYWDIDPALALKGVNGVAKKSGSVTTWNMFEWDKE